MRFGACFLLPSKPNFSLRWAIVLFNPKSNLYAAWKDGIATTIGQLNVGYNVLDHTFLFETWPARTQLTGYRLQEQVHREIRDLKIKCFIRAHMELYKIGFERVQWKYRLCHYRLEDGNFTSIKHARFRFSWQKSDRRVIPASKCEYLGLFLGRWLLFKTWLAESSGYMVWTIHSTAHLLDNLSSERTRPMYPKRNWVNGTEAHLLDTGFFICSSLTSRVWFGPISPRITWSHWPQSKAAQRPKWLSPL